MHFAKLKKRLEKLVPSDFGSVILLWLIPLLLIALYILLYRYTLMTQNQIEKIKFASQLSAGSISGYPFMLNVYQPFLTAESAIIMDEPSQVVLYSKNPTLRFAMASTTKIMTALVAMEHFKEDDVITIYSGNTPGTVVGFSKGEKLRFIDVVYGMMLPSGNDAAYAIADNYPGGRDAFVKAMNEKAKELHLYSTGYLDPAGLNDDGNYTSSLDLVRLTSVAMKNKKFMEIVGTKNRTIATITGTKSYPITNINRLLGYDGVIGVKTGFTEGAGGVLVTAKEEGGRKYIIAVIKSQDRFADTVSLLNYLRGNVSFEHFKYR